MAHSATEEMASLAQSKTIFKQAIKRSEDSMRLSLTQLLKSPGDWNKISNGDKAAAL
jgi:hypothetical protein